MNIYKLYYQHYKDIVDDNVLKVFVLANNEDEVKQFAKKAAYSIEKIEEVSQEEYEKERKNGNSFGLEHADKFLD